MVQRNTENYSRKKENQVLARKMTENRLRWYRFVERRKDYEIAKKMSEIGKRGIKEEVGRRKSEQRYEGMKIYEKKMPYKLMNNSFFFSFQRNLKLPCQVRVNHLIFYLNFHKIWSNYFFTQIVLETINMIKN